MHIRIAMRWPLRKVDVDPLSSRRCPRSSATGVIPRYCPVLNANARSLATWLSPNSVNRVTAVALSLEIPGKHHARVPSQGPRLEGSEAKPPFSNPTLLECLGPQSTNLVLQTIGPKAHA